MMLISRASGSRPLDADLFRVVSLPPTGGPVRSDHALLTILTASAWTLLLRASSCSMRSEGPRSFASSDLDETRQSRAKGPGSIPAASTFQNRSQRLE